MVPLVGALLIMVGGTGMLTGSSLHRRRRRSITDHPGYAGYELPAETPADMVALLQKLDGVA